MKRRTSKVWRTIATAGIVIVGMSSIQPAFADTLPPPPPPPINAPKPPVLPAPGETSPIDTKHGDLHGASGRLGNAVGSVVTGLANGGSMQKYEHGYIYYTKATGAHVIEGAIGAKWIAMGAQNSILGYPKTDVVSGLKGGGSTQTFASGAIVSSPATGMRISRGAIGSKWIATGSQSGVLGYPTSDEIAGANGGAYQKYQGGNIYWSPTTGVHLTRGGIGSTWASAGSEKGFLGYPVTDEIGRLKNGGAYQQFQRGFIYWSPTTGARTVIGAIRSKWAATGAEKGRLGYPTSNEYAYGGGVRQNFQHGYITYTAKRGATIH